jgi:hypothetical protein
MRSSGSIRASYGVPARAATIPNSPRTAIPNRATVRSRGCSTLTRAAEPEGNRLEGGHNKAKPDETSSVKLDAGLYIVATPIGNLQDITLRALRVLKAADAILAEDTRHSRKLLHAYNLDTPLVSFHAFNEKEKQDYVLDRLASGQVCIMASLACSHWRHAAWVDSLGLRAGVLPAVGSGTGQ